VLAPAPAERSPQAAIQLDGLGKAYWKLEEQAMLLKAILPFHKIRRTRLWALRDIDLTVNRGETIGLIGHNGAGKTSLLRLMSGVSQPTEGRLQIVGRIAPLISVGVGFNREMSGRENVYVNGMLLGLSRSEIDDRFDAIVAFAELADFIDTPVKFYSSGMFMRLGFAVAVHVDAEVLLVDEVLAVGDIAFQLKCYERMRQIVGTGTTVVLVSHSMNAIQSLCPRAVVLRRGRMEFDGRPEDAIPVYHDLLSKDTYKLNGERITGDDTHGGVEIVANELIGPLGPTHRAGPEESVTLRTRLRFERAIDSPNVFFKVTTEDGIEVYQRISVLNRQGRTYAPGEEATLEIDFVPRLGGGTYRLTVSVISADGRLVYAHDGAGVQLSVPWAGGASGIAHLDAVMRLDDTVLSDYDSLLLAPPDPPR